MNPRLKKHLDAIRLRAALKINSPFLGPGHVRVQLLEEKIHIAGHIRVREVPFKTEEEWRYWWLGEFQMIDRVFTMVRPPRMSEKEKDTYTVAESENILVASGIAQLLNYVGSQTGYSVGFSQYLAFGNGQLNKVKASDTSLVNEQFRLATSVASLSGVQTDISVLSALSGSPVSITEAGLYGNGATSTPASGTLLTHSLLQYTQPASGGNLANVTYDYLISYV